MKGLLEDYRKVFHEIDRLYYENPSPEIRKLNDDLVFAIRNAVKERFKFLGSVDKATRELETALKLVEPKCREKADEKEDGVSRLKKMLERVTKILENKINEVKTKLEEIKAKRLNLESEAKELIRQGRMEDAEILVRRITPLEKSEKILKNIITILSRAAGRCESLIDQIDVLQLLKGINISKLSFEKVRELRNEAENAMRNLSELEKDIGTALNIFGTTDVLSGTLNEEELKTFKRLMEEAETVSEEARRYIEGLEDAERKLKDMKS